MADGTLNPEYPINQINQKGVFRKDLGDVKTLAESMDQLGLLTPVVVTNDGDLICGKRRLAAAMKLGWETIPVWIPAKVSQQLRLHALVDDDACSKPLSPIEQAELYAEYEQLYAQQAALRKQATQFVVGNTAAAKAVGNGIGEENGCLDSRQPFSDLPEEPPRASHQAAHAVTGHNAATRLDQIRELQAIACDDREHPRVQQSAIEALTSIEDDGKVNPRWQDVKTGQYVYQLDDTAADPTEPKVVQEAAALAARAARDQTNIPDAYKQARAGIQQVADLHKTNPKPVKPVDPDLPRKRAVRLLGELLIREHGWWERNQPDDYAQFADQEQLWLLTSYRDGITQFTNQVLALKAADAAGQEP